ncbi:hypothetical protein V6N13_107918 [Hibiscus sabdariffa]
MVNPECKEGRLRGAAGAPDLGKSPSLEGSSDVGVVLGEVVVAQGVVNHDGKLLVQPPREVLDLGGEAMVALLRNFMEKSPLLGVFRRIANKLWAERGQWRLDFLAPSVYLINFPSQRVRDWVLESSPWHILQKAIILRNWLPGMNFDIVSLDTAPVWIKFWHIPLELYSQQGLGYLASALGKPMYADKATALKQHLEYAKICVEIGNCFEISVELDWGPPRCSKCVLFGHSDDKCKRGVLSQAEPEVGFNKDVVPSQQAVAEECLVTVDVAASSAVCGDSDIRENAEAIGVDSNKLGNCDVPIVFTSHEPDILSQMNGDTIVDGSRVVVSVPSANMFDALCEAVEQDVVARPVRAAAGGVANLMKKFKPKEKGEEESEG